MLGKEPNAYQKATHALATLKGGIIATFIGFYLPSCFFIILNLLDIFTGKQMETVIKVYSSSEHLYLTLFMQNKMYYQLTTRKSKHNHILEALIDFYDYKAYYCDTSFFKGYELKKLMYGNGKEYKVKCSKFSHCITEIEPINKKSK